MKTDEEIKDAGVYDITQLYPVMLAGYIKLPECKRCSVVWGRDENGMEHVSVAPLNRFHTPSWDEMCLVKDTFFYAEEECYEIHPKNSQYVNKVNNCLHIWRPKNGLTIDAITSVNLEPSTNGPLTIEELRKMDGDKIYIQFIGVCKGFCDDEYAPYYGQHEQYIQKHNGMLICCDLLLKYYGEAWLAYRRKPDCSHWKDEEADHEQ